MNNPAGYLFDMDGLLLDTERLGQHCFVQAAAEFELPETSAAVFFLNLVGSGRAEHDRLMATYLPPHIALDAFEDAWSARYTAALENGVPLIDTVIDALDQLKDQNARMAVVTSTSGARARDKLARAGLLDHFEFLIGGDEVPANKPDPAPYLLGAQKLGIDPRRCAAFEDSDRGITAAVRAGCIATQIPNLRPAETAFPQLGQRFAKSLKEAVDNLICATA